MESLENRVQRARRERLKREQRKYDIGGLALAIILYGLYKLLIEGV